MCGRIAVMFAIISLASPVVATVIPADKNAVVPLDGNWRFKLEQKSTLSDTSQASDTRGAQKPLSQPTSPEPFFRPDYAEDRNWHDLRVPGNWEMAGYSPATYWQPDNASGLYRKWVDIPGAWAGKVVKVNFDGVQCGAEIWLNGQPVDVTEPSWGRSNYHEGGWTAWQADLSPAVEFGQRNLLALRVTKNTRSSDLDSGDYFFLGGIHRPVTLFCVPQAHIEDITIETKLLPENKAEVKVVAAVVGPASEIAVELEDSQRVTTKAADSKATVDITVPNPRLWSAEHPNLYSLNVSLLDGDGKTIERITRRVGIREISVKNGIFMVNGVPVKLTGVCRHDVSAREGTAVGNDLWRKDLTLMKAANINAIRTSHYPYGSGFYDLCDEMGFYVADELPYCWAPVADASLEPAFAQRARETVARDKNHACVVMWAIGNENKDGVNNQTVADLVKSLDPTRPSLVSCKKADLYGTDFDDLHYTNPDRMLKTLEDKERRAKWPQVFLENPNVWDVRFGADYGCLDLWHEVLGRTWDVVWNNAGIPGAFLWEWQDRAVADKCPTKLYQYDSTTGINYLKVKGLVDAFRNTRPDYYQVKMVYAPIVVSPRLDPAAGPGKAVIQVQNRYSFTDLSELATNWKLLKDGRPIDSGTAHPRLAPLSKGVIELPLSGNAMAKADTLRIDYDHPGGWNVVSYQFQLASPRITSCFSPVTPDGMKFPKFNLVRNVTSSDPDTWRRITRCHGELINVNTEPAASTPYYERSLDTVRSLDADIVLADAAPAEPKGSRENPKNVPQLGAILGHVHVEYTGAQFSYRIDWSGPRSDIQELGWVFEMPKGFDHFSWQRQARWSVYPDNHIGRPAGTALPETARVHLTRVDRPDAYDFNSTKYNCDWAALTNAERRGLRAEFSADQRHHVKGGFSHDGGYRLIVNKQCSPPRDISSSSVQDLYLELSVGDQIKGTFRIGSNTVIR